MNGAQLELSLNNARTQAQPQYPQRRLNRAQWWFQRMRQVVERARDWQPVPAPRAEQIWFSGTHRLIQTGPRPVCA